MRKVCLGVVVVFCTKGHLQGHACLHTTKHVRCVHMPACKHIHAVANTIPVLYIHIHTYVCMYICIQKMVQVTGVFVPC